MGVIGIDLGGTKTFGGLVEGSQIRHERYSEHGHGETPATDDPGGESFLRLSRFIDAVIEETRRGGDTVTGIGLGAPSIVDRAGTVIASPPLGWRNFPLRDCLEERFRLPVVVENDVNLAAVGEVAHGAARGAKTALCLSLGTGIGGGVVIDGRLHRGKNGAAGEIGAFLPGREFLPWHNPEWGALESVSSGSGIAARVPKELGSLTASQVFAAAANQESWAAKLIEETIDYLSLAIGAVQVILDPDVVVLGGGMSATASILIPGLERRLATALPFPPRIVASTLGYRAPVLGAAVLVAGS